jgi:hypothetical protein
MSATNKLGQHNKAQLEETNSDRRSLGKVRVHVAFWIIDTGYS